MRRTVQIVFQDPYSSLDPMRTVGSALREVLASTVRRRRTRAQRRRSCSSASACRVGYAERKPGGALRRRAPARRDRARACAVGPEVIVCDEPVSALDVSVQAQILNLFRSLRDEFGLGYLFITHDLAVVRQVVDRVYVLYRGEIVEQGDVDARAGQPDARLHGEADRLGAAQRLELARSNEPRASVGIAGFWHETNSFSPFLTDLAAFSGATGDILRGPAAMAGRYRERLPDGGLRAAPRESARASARVHRGRLRLAVGHHHALDVRHARPARSPTACWGSATGRVPAQPPRSRRRRRLRRSRGRDRRPPPQRRPRIPIGVVLDHHAGVSEELIAASDIVVGYKTEPHIDLGRVRRARGAVALDLARGAIDRIERCFVRLPVMLPIENLLTTPGRSRA